MTAILETRLGEPIDRVDGLRKVTGAAPYPSDVSFPRLAHAALVQSTIAAGTISRIDAGDAEATPGVLAVITHESRPALAKGPMTPLGPTPPLPLEDNRVLHHGQHLAIVVAQTREQAAAAGRSWSRSATRRPPALSGSRGSARSGSWACRRPSLTPSTTRLVGASAPCPSPSTSCCRRGSDMSTIEAVREKRTPTPASVWQAVAGTTIGDELLEWPPDLFAATDVILERSEAYRFALSPPAGVAWPPTRIPGWADAVADVSRRWSAWVEGRVGELPDLLVQEWARFRDAAGTPLADFAEARDWGLCVALLTLHAIADEACAGLGVTVDASTATGLLYRARGRELLARTGSLTRIPSHLVRVLPKVRTPPNGTSLRSLSRYACVHRPGVEARWHKVPSREPHDRGVNYLLLPWPLRVRESDFGPLAGSVQHQGLEPFGFFEFAPSEALDLDLVDRLLVAALDEVERVDVVVLPESAVDEDEIDGLEALVGSHGVQGLIAGVRGHSEQPGQFPGNWVHLAVSTGEQWARFRQHKHHRWSLDEDQIHQYNLGGALHPRLRWWEAMEVPRRSVQFVDVGEGGTVVALVCEDLAQIDDVAEVVRSVGPMIVITPLLDGPQLRSRWAARYASVLADDPGSAVLTLTSLGMAQRCRPQGREPSDVIALWKDPGRGTREIPLEAGAQGVLLSANTGRAARRSFDGRQPVESGSELYNMSVFQVRASPAGSGWADLQAGPPSPALLAVDELTILMSWAEAVADALAFAPERIAAVAAAAHAGTPWRALLGIPEPSPRLNHATSVMFDVVRGATAAGDDLALDALILAMRERQPGEASLDRLVHRVLRSALELRQSQRSDQDDHIDVQGPRVTPGGLPVASPDGQTP